MRDADASAAGAASERAGADRMRHRLEVRLTVVGVVSLVVALTITESVGRIYASYQILNLLRGMSAALQFLGSAVFSALAAILGLTVTSVSLLRGLHAERLTPNFLTLIRTTAVLCIAGMGLSLLLILTTIVPTAQDEVVLNVNVLYFLYYSVIGLVSVIVGLVMMLMFLLMDTINAVLASLPTELIEKIRMPVDETITDNAKEEAQST